jgi:hypothetical protein
LICEGGKTGRLCFPPEEARLGALGAVTQSLLQQQQQEPIFEDVVGGICEMSFSGFIVRGGERKCLGIEKVGRREID